MIQKACIFDRTKGDWMKEWQKCKSIFFCNRELAFNNNSCVLHNIRITSASHWAFLSLNNPNFDKFTRIRPLIILSTTSRPITVMHWYPPVVVHFSCVARIQSFSCESLQTCYWCSPDTHSLCAIPHAPHSKNTENLQYTSRTQSKTTRRGAIQLLLHQEPISRNTPAVNIKMIIKLILQQFKCITSLHREHLLKYHGA